jgi:AcrR family transcriptional regulator
VIEPHATPEAGRGPRRRRALVHNRDREREVLAAAHQVFLDKGFARATIAEIAARARVAEGTIYRFAPTKRALLERVIVDWYAGMIETLRGQLAGAAGLEARLGLFARHQFTIFTDHAPLSRLLVRELRTSADYRESALHKANRAYTALFLEILEDGRRQGQIRTAMSPALLRDLFFGTIEHATLAGLEPARRTSREAEFLEMFLMLLRTR